MNSWPRRPVCHAAVMASQGTTFERKLPLCLLALFICAFIAVVIYQIRHPSDKSLAMATIRADIHDLKVLAKEQDDTIQAMLSEVDELRGEVRRAREDLEAARVKLEAEGKTYLNASDSTTK